jgi:hypothetical protein
MAIEVHWKTGPGLIESVYAALKCSSFHFKRTHSSRTADGILCGLVMVPTGEGE